MKQQPGLPVQPQPGPVQPVNPPKPYMTIKGWQKSFTFTKECEYQIEIKIGNVPEKNIEGANVVAVIDDKYSIVVGKIRNGEAKICIPNKKMLEILSDGKQHQMYLRVVVLI